MLTGLQALNEIFTLLKEPYDATGATDKSHWSRATMATRLNMSQDELSLSLPGLFWTSDSSLTTVLGQMEYTIPATVGRIRQVSINGIQLNRTTLEAIQGNSIRGDLVSATEFVQDWAAITGFPFSFYQSADGLSLGLYTKPATTGDTIKIEGELLLSLITDTAGSYLLDNLPMLRKAQKYLIYKTAEECALEDGNMPFADRLHPLADKMMEELRTYWFVLKDTDPQSTIIFKEYEGPSVSPLNRQISR
jgi:hypothetical protein